MQLDGLQSLLHLSWGSDQLHAGMALIGRTGTKKLVNSAKPDLCRQVGVEQL